MPMAPINREEVTVIKAVAYMRTSSSTNVGEGKDSEPRQRAAIAAYAAAAGYEIVAWFYDAAVRGADSIDSRDGFVAMLEYIEVSGVRTIIVETANRFARDLMVQEVGFDMLRKAGITLIAADSPSAFLDDGPTSKLIRQILGAVAEFEKASMVAKLRGARERKRKATGKKVGGRASHAELNPEMVARAKALSGLSLRGIATQLAQDGFLSETGGTFAPMSIKRILAQAVAQ